MTNVTRKNSPLIKVRVLPAEKEAIEENARRVGLSTSAYLRNVGLGIEVRGVLDQQAVVEMSKVNGDIGRLGGLLKMWLTNDERLALFNQQQLQESIVEALAKIKVLQDELLQVVKRL
ncbi:conjugal transfer transcriptional regulator TraJ [Metapseudomonas furukawaii]|uniref:conjugal transfer transcriptional regulator TraJ n=1 Tax=Metapseudomonas furukawaii TaxID=1149133 RepID=UPI000568614B|nr:conjugal transfer transcriptional regulator TraJ [Pseudomonas furukawaii]